MLKRVLIANRGEIALRILRACREADIEAEAVYSQADAEARYVQLATRAVCIGLPPAAQSYLNQTALLTVAKATGCDGVHPGYGFLSGNGDFADRCGQEGLTFIGPSGDTIRKAWSKSVARKLMQQAGIPITPGSDGPVSSEAEALEVAGQVGLPVLLRASSGGRTGGFADVMTMAETLTAAQRVIIARHPQRPNINDYIDALFPQFFAMCGDRLFGEDKAILGGVALFHGQPVTVIGIKKGRMLEENLKCNFGMPNPEGYRKALRLMKWEEKFGRPVITFIDTVGAYPGMQAEEHGQGEAIARNLYEMSRLTTPVICVITGEGNSGGALALGVANRVLMLENAV